MEEHEQLWTEMDCTSDGQFGDQDSIPPSPRPREIEVGQVQATISYLLGRTEDSCVH